MKTVFLRVLHADNKAAALLEGIRAPEPALGRWRFEVDPASFAGVPGSPFAYWISESLRAAFRRGESFENSRRSVRIGISTHSDFRWIRLSWETSRPDWGVPFAKGGSFSPYYADVHLLLGWGEDGRMLKVSKRERFRLGELTENNSRCWNESWYFRPGITWPRRTTSGISVRAMPAGCIFADKGPAVFVENDEGDGLLALLAVANSRPFTACLELQLAAADAAARSYEVGLVRRTPVPEFVNGSRDALAHLAHLAWSLKRSLDTCAETSHAFTLPALLQVEGSDPAGRAEAWSQHVRAAEVELARIQSEIDERCFELYGIYLGDRRVISEGFGTGTPDVLASETVDDGDDASVAEAEENDASVNAVTLAAELVGWAVGVAFGRFDVRLATGEREAPPEPGPFDPLSACSPGMLTRSDGLPATDTPDAYPLDWPNDGIMVGDVGHSEDLVARVRDVFEVAFGEAADAWWEECAQLLGGDLRRWLARDFFGAHLKGYSKSRRKAPIYWQLATPTGSYSVWLYAHRVNPDTLFRVLNDIITPKLRHEERRLTSLTQEAGPSPSASQRKDVESQRDFVEELRSFSGELARIAPLWRPELDDGVLITCAPLWRLMPQHRAWQREVRACWPNAAKGEYDWAHLAMHLWPERVVPKCAQDRSLAIAHGLEEELWAEDADGKWASRQVDSATVERLVQERSSAAVKAALADLLAAG